MAAAIQVRRVARVRSVVHGPAAGGAGPDQALPRPGAGSHKASRRRTVHMKEHQAGPQQAPEARAGAGRRTEAWQVKVAAAVERAEALPPVARAWAPSGPTPAPDGPGAIGRLGGESARCGPGTPNVRTARRHPESPTVTRPVWLDPRAAVEASGGRCRRSCVPSTPRQVCPPPCSTMAHTPGRTLSVGYLAALMLKPPETP